MKKDDVKIKSLVEILEILRHGTKRMFSQETPIEEVLDRVVGYDLYAPEDLPHYSRVSRDGYALLARDTFGATPEEPRWLEVVRELKVGEVVEDHLQPGTVIKVATGGMLPPDADAVVMVEDVQVGEDGRIGIKRPYSPGENLIPVGSDLKVNQKVLPKGHLIRPQDVAILAALGFEDVYVVRQPKVAIISTGDELLGITENLRPGKVRDLNTYGLAAAVECTGGIPVPYGIVPDDPVQLRKVMERAVVDNDLVLISGGSSVGSRDYTQEILESLGEVLCTGLRMSPGKSALIALVDDKLVFGLPGYPVGAMVVFELVVKPYLHQLLNRVEEPAFYIKARLAVEIPPHERWDHYLRVRLENRSGEYWAIPIPGETALISTLVQASGLVKVTAAGVKAGEMVEVRKLSGGNR